ncbi:MAG TPA: ketol-acid reductoisomerase [Novosphingobium sp.]|nr:ketol-acid reductoisomerase [Novosphingobium sp.]
MRIYRAEDIDPAPLAGKRIAIVGYGNQGRAQALNLADGGFDVVVGLREGSASAERCAADGIACAPIEQSVEGAALTMLLAPDETLGPIYARIAPFLGQGTAIGFSHGLAIRFGDIDPRPALDVIMIAPQGPGTALRSLFEAGAGMPALFAVAQDASSSAEAMALAYGRAIGCARAGLIPSSFAEECEADLFNEAAVVWGAVPEILVAGYETLVEAGFSEEVAFMECVGELKLLADLIEQRGIAGMREAISNTAELGAVTGGPRIVDGRVRAEMRAILARIRSGDFAALLRSEASAGHPMLEQARRAAAASPVERARTRIAALFGR